MGGQKDTHSGSTPTSMGGRVVEAALTKQVPPWLLIVAMLSTGSVSGVIGGGLGSSVTEQDLDRLAAKVDTLDAKLTELRIAIAIAHAQDPGATP